MVPNMSEEFGPDFITVTDEDGNEFELEHLDTLEYNGQTYMAFFPAVEGKEDGSVEDVDLDEEYGLVILKVIEADGEEQLSTLDSEEELELVYQQFMESLFDAHLMAWTAGLPAPLRGTAGSWKQRSDMEATHLPLCAGFKWIRTARAGPPRNAVSWGFSYFRHLNKV